MSHACWRVRAGKSGVLSPDGQIHCKLQATTLPWTERKPAVVSQISPNRSTLENAEIVLHQSRSSEHAHTIVISDSLYTGVICQKGGDHRVWADDYNGGVAPLGLCTPNECYESYVHSPD